MEISHEANRQNWRFPYAADVLLAAARKKATHHEARRGVLRDSHGAVCLLGALGVMEGGDNNPSYIVGEPQKRAIRALGFTGYSQAWRFNDTLSYNRAAGEGLLPGAACIASACMAWRWRETPNPAWRPETMGQWQRNPLSRTPYGVPSATDGYCGLACRP